MFSVRWERKVFSMFHTHLQLNTAIMWRTIGRSLETFKRRAVPLDIRGSLHRKAHYIIGLLRWLGFDTERVQVDFMVGKLVLGQICSKYLHCFMSSFHPVSLSSANSTRIRRTSGRSFAVFEQKFSPLGNRGTSSKKNSIVCKWEGLCVRSGIVRSV